MSYILVVEDEISLSQALYDNLDMAGFKVKIAANGDEALSHIKKSAPSLILTDLLMPRKDGFELVSEIKAHKAWKCIPIIVLSNLDGDTVKHQLYACGVDAYFIKSEHSLKEIISQVRDCLQKSQPAQLT